jgi:hypothetical protein
METERQVSLYSEKRKETFSTIFPKATPFSKKKKKKKKKNRICCLKRRNGVLFVKKK